MSDSMCSFCRINHLRRMSHSLGCNLTIQRHASGADLFVHPPDVVIKLVADPGNHPDTREWWVCHLETVGDSCTCEKREGV
jgi:hypothetical protein